MCARAALAAALAIAAALTAHAPPAAANTTQESIFMDDPALVYGSPDSQDKRLAQMKALGADRIRISVFWRTVAPSPDDKQKPSFSGGGESDPAAYPAKNWERYDRLVSLAQNHGLKVLLNITTPAPSWATGTPSDGTREEVYEPNPEDLRAFTRAVGTRYSGSYAAPSPTNQNQQQQQLLPPIGGNPPPPQNPPQQSAPLPKVDFWSIMNEPNFPAWLGPQRVASEQGGGKIPPAHAAKIYRALADAVYGGLAESGHGTDTILLGETAPRGYRRASPNFGVRPLEFIRELYCLDPHFRPFRGAAAQVRDCPVTPDQRRQFPTQHASLFQATGWAHHPYYLDAPPTSHDPEVDNAPLADLPRLTLTLDAIFRQYGQPRKLPIWITEYGYQTDPPDPLVGVSWARQAAYLNQSDFMAYLSPRVQSTAQFLLLDDGPRRDFAASDPRYWGTFQTGLMTNDGKPKTSYTAYQRPIDVEPQRQRPGGKLTAWGQLRPAADNTPLAVTLQFKRGRSGPWSNVKSALTRNPRGFTVLHLKATATGYYRLVWTDPGSGAALRTRIVQVKVAQPAKAKKPASTPVTPKTPPS